jgi:N-acetylmuramoyl-L-alanine amidase
MRARWASWLMVLAFCGGIALLRVHSAEEKKLTIYSPQTTYTLSITEHDKKDYVPVFALLEPVAKPSLRIDRRTYHLEANQVAGEFKEGSSSAKIGNAKFDMDGALVVESGQALVPVASVARILGQYLKRPIDFHESARRLFIDNAAMQFASQVKKGEPPALVLSFPAPVSPAIHAEGNTLHLVFARDPVFAGTGTTPLNDKLLTSSTFRESNGAAELTVSGSSPLLANFADNGKTIIITAAPAPATAAAANTTPATTTPAAAAPAPAPPSSAETNAVAPPPLLPPAPRFFVMIDPGHGGSDPGAKLSDILLEKDITLAFARKLRIELQNRGIPAVLLRDSDATLTFDQRALSTNVQRASMYIALHAAVPGSGVRVFSALLPAPSMQEKPQLFVPWDSAQNPFAEKSRILAAAIVEQFADGNTHAMMATSPLRPLNNVSAVAVGIEIAGRDPQALAAAKLHQSLAAMIAAGVVEAKARIESLNVRGSAP